MHPIATQQTYYAKSVIPPPDTKINYREIIYHIDSQHRNRNVYPKASSFRMDLDEHQIRDVKMVSLIGYNIPTTPIPRLDRTNNLLHITNGTKQYSLELDTTHEGLTASMLLQALNKAVGTNNLPLQFQLVDRRIQITNQSNTDNITLLFANSKNNTMMTYLPRSVGKLLGWNAVDVTISPLGVYAPETNVVLEPYEYCVLFMNGIKRILSPFPPHTHAFAILPFQTNTHCSRNYTDLPYEKNLPNVLPTIKQLSVKLLTPYGDELDIPPDKNVQIQVVFKCMKQPTSFHVT